MSIEGEDVSIKSLFLSYSPVVKKSNNTLFSFEAQISLLTGIPISFAKYAARIFPKFPVGTTKLIFSPAFIAPFLSMRPYAYT